MSAAIRFFPGVTSITEATRRPVDHPIVRKIRRLEQVRPRTLRMLESVVDRLLRNDDDDQEGGA
jgi:hypothetical protein